MWSVSESHGLLPSSPPIAPSAMPASWQPLVQLGSLVPSACVPPSTFRAHVLKALPLLPKDDFDLYDEMMRERGRCVLAYVLAGWHAST